MKTLIEAASTIEKFERGSLTQRISGIETVLVGLDKRACEEIYPALSIKADLFDSAVTIKKLAGQINVLIHAIGILLSLPHILEEGEKIEALSLGAGNSGRPFDLETNRRVAEFKFINWQGGAEVIRQNSMFKDYYLMAENPTSKAKYLYVIGTKHPLKFLNSGRALSSVFSRNIKLWAEFQQRYGTQFIRVCDYYEFRKSAVQLVDVTPMIPQLAHSDGLELDNTEA
jgi:hypothetical protein